MKKTTLELSTTGSAGAKITLEKAKAMIGAYQTKVRAMPASNPPGLLPLSSLKIKAEFLRALTEKDECVYVRFFVAQQPQPVGPAGRVMLDDQTLVLVGVDATGKNLIKYGIYEDLGVCPTGCPDPGGNNI
jgi:hypothetical protein